MKREKERKERKDHWNPRKKEHEMEGDHACTNDNELGAKGNFLEKIDCMNLEGKKKKRKEERKKKD